ncbi:MAG: TatD family hydrolase [Thermoplasmatota archaeon]
MTKDLDAIPIHDNHFHCHPAGWKGLDAVREFMAAGGTSIAHIRLPSYPSNVEAFEQSCRDHIAFGQKIRDETGCRVWTVLGPYPLEPLKIAEAQGWEAATAYGRACYDAAARFIEAGDAVCMGEVGRPHFEVDDEAWAASNELLSYGMGLCADLDVPILLHTEHTDPDVMAEFAAMADGAGLARDRVIKHYCGPLVKQEENHGLFPSVIAGRSNIRAALAKQSDRFMLETDYIDEPTRPNVVMPPTTVPKRVRGLLQSGELPEETAWKMGKEWPEAFYGA